MRWRDERRSDNVEDDQGGGMPAGGMVLGGGIGTLVIFVIAVLLGADPRQLLQQMPANPQPGANAGPGAAPGQPAGPVDPAREELKDFVRVVLASTEDVWTDEFKKMGKTYELPKLDLFRGQVNSACGLADSAVGPFYCPGDSKVYLDLSFFDELRRRFKAPGEFAEAYVVAHEIGHHVQNLLGITRKVDALTRRAGSKAEANALSVRLELQADFLAGVWANHANKMRNILEQGDVESALRAASAIGDDTLQRQSRGYVVPDAFTHGSSEQRVRWFKKGLQTGDVDQGDTFQTDRL